MNVSYNTFFSYAGQAKNSAYQYGKGAKTNGSADIYALSDKSERISRAREIKSKLNELHTEKDENINPYQNNKFSETLFERLYESTKETSKSKKANTKKYNYNPQDVANKILRAKTPLSAAQAMRSARRKVQEVRRKLQDNSNDSEELQLALTHARRMELAAQKKKHNLEQEELVENTRRRDESSDKMEENRESLHNTMVFAEEEKVSQAEDDVFEARDEAILDFAEEVQESGVEPTEDMMAELNEQMNDFGEEMLSELEDMMEMLENMEILDPHMSEEKLEEVKRKHRSAEERAILKANMDYLKNVVKLMNTKGAESSFSAMSSMNAGVSSAVSVAASVSVASPAAVAMPSIDVSA